MDALARPNVGSLTWCEDQLLECFRLRLFQSVEQVVSDRGFPSPHDDLPKLEGRGLLLPGEVVLLAGPSGSGKTHMREDMLVRIPEIVESVCSRFGELSPISSRKGLASAEKGVSRLVVVVCQPHLVSLEASLMRTFRDDTTMVDRELLPPLSRALPTIALNTNAENSSTTGDSAGLPSGVLCAFEIALPTPHPHPQAGTVVAPEQRACEILSCPRDDHLLLSLPTWDHFELAFGSYSSVAAQSRGGDSEGRPLSLALVGEQKEESTDEGAAGPPSEAHPTFACSPELLAHFMTLSHTIKGSSPAFFRREPGVLSGRSPRETTERRIYQMSFVVCECSMPSPFNMLDPLLHHGPAFGLKLYLPTPTYEERRGILRSYVEASEGPPSAGMLLPLVDALVARTGGHTGEYIAALGQYLAASVDASRGSLLLPVHVEGDASEGTSSLCERLLKEFEGVWMSVADEALDLLAAGHPGRLFVGGNSKAALGHVDVQRTLWSDVAGHGEAKEKLKSLLLRPLRHKEIYSKHGLAPSLGAILYGPPGTGKTMLAKAMATEASASFIYLDLADLISCEIGESERVLAEFFNVGKSRAPCILFMDELQAAFGRRYDVARGGNNAAHDARLVSALLALLDNARRTFFEAPVVFVGATNMIEVIDEAILRPGRLDVHVFVGPPDEAARRALIESYIYRRWATWIATTGEEDAVLGETLPNLLAGSFLTHSAGLTGAEIKNALNQFALDTIIDFGGRGHLASTHDRRDIEEAVRRCCLHTKGSVS